MVTLWHWGNHRWSLGLLNIRIFNLKKPCMWVSLSFRTFNVSLLFGWFFRRIKDLVLRIIALWFVDSLLLLSCFFLKNRQHRKKQRILGSQKLPTNWLSCVGFQYSWDVKWMSVLGSSAQKTTYTKESQWHLSNDQHPVCKKNGLYYHILPS